MKTQTIKDIRALLDSKKASASEIAKERLEDIKSRDKAYNSVITIDEDITMAMAKEADERLAKGDKGPLTGVPFLVKDLFCQKNWRTSCSSLMLESFNSPYTATVIQNLVDAGMVTLGRTNMDEFAMGSTTESSHYGATKNPWDVTRVPGGSSGGAAAALAARFAPASIGSDTGGSIRQPASHCGVTGIKPTYGLISRLGMVAYASSFDQAGPMAITAEDCATLLNAMVSFDPKDSTSLERDKEDYLKDIEKDIKGVKVGLPKEYMRDELDPEVAKVVNETLETLKKLGCEIKEVSLPRTDLCIPAYYVLAAAEASTNLSRYDGVRYGYRAKDVKNIEELYVKSRSEGFGEEVQRRIMMGAYVLSAGYYDAYYVKAAQLRRMIFDDFAKVFEEVDFIVSPAAPAPAPKLGSQTSDPVKMYLSDIYTTSTNLAGLPGISIPQGFSSEGLPIGVQFVGPHFSESLLLRAAHNVQKVTDYHMREPKEV